MSSASPQFFTYNSVTRNLFSLFIFLLVGGHGTMDRTRVSHYLQVDRQTADTSHAAGLNLTQQY